jgi:hypothetical protein
MVLSLLTYIACTIGQEGTTIDVAGCALIDVDGSSTLRSFCTQQLVQHGGAGIREYFGRHWL